MRPTFITDYSTDGGPLLIAPLSSAAAWRGVQDHGAGYRVSYVSRFAKLPRELRLSRRAGMQVREFATAAEATAFELRVLAVLRELHPTAEVRSDPGQHIGDLGDERAFSVETSHRSMYDVVCDELPGDDARILSPEGVQALFLDDEAGAGTIRADERTGAVFVAHRHYSDVGDPEQMWAALAELLPGKARARSKGTLRVDGPLFVFPAVYAAGEIASANWGSDSLSALPSGAVAASRSLNAPEWTTPCGAVIVVPAGDYQVHHHHDVELAGAGARVLWLLPT